MNLRILGPNKTIKILIFIILIGYIAPCENINYRYTQYPRIIVHYNLIINMYFNHESHITRKLMKMKNGNHTNNNKKDGNKDDKNQKLYHKVIVWNKDSPTLAYDQAKFPIIQRAILKYEPNLIVLSEANISEENLNNVKGEFEGYDIHYKISPTTKFARIAVLVKKSTIHLTRIEELEHPDLACMWFKLRLDDQTIILSAWYRQWQLPIEIRNARTLGVDGQVERIKIFQKQVKEARKISQNVMILGDINIDMLEENDQEDKSHIARTMPIYREILEENGMSILNKKPTWYKKKQKALLDHISTNRPTHVSNIKTEPVGTSDHMLVSFDLKTKENTENPKYHYSQNWKKANKPDIELGIALNPDLQEMWATRDHERVWNLLIKGANDICNTYAPSKIVQRRTKFQPYINDEIKEIEVKVKMAFENATITGDQKEWQKYNKEKSIYQSTLDKAKNSFLANKMLSPRGVWNFITTITGGSNISIPTILIEAAKTVTSNGKIANIMNNFFYIKIKKIVLAFKPITYDPLIFLKNLIKKPGKRLIIPQISTKQAEDIIRKSYNSSARGFNETSMKFLKITPKLGPHTSQLP